MAAAAASTREQYVDETRKRLHEWNAQLDDVEARLTRARAASREELERQLRRTRELYAATSARLREVTQDRADATAVEETRYYVILLERSIRHLRSHL